MKSMHLGEEDAAMYRAKERGRARFEVFDDLMRMQATERLETGNDLHRALERGELRVHYQPIVSLPSGGVQGVETAVQRRELVELGCDAAQGFFYARPQPSSFMPSLVTSARATG